MDELYEQFEHHSKIANRCKTIFCVTAIAMIGAAATMVLGPMVCWGLGMENAFCHLVSQLAMVTAISFLLVLYVNLMVFSRSVTKEKVIVEQIEERKKKESETNEDEQ
jgi:membrane protein implicated in regulation of membrane protease activity